MGKTWERGREPCASHTRGAGLSWKAPVLWPYLPFPSSGSRTLYGAKAPNSSAANPGVPTSQVPGAGKQRACSGDQRCAP